MRLIVTVLISGLAAAMAAAMSPAFAAQSESLDARVQLTSDRIGFDVQGRYENYTLTIAGPQGYAARAEGRRSAPTVRLADHGETPDGVYNFNLTAATDQIAPQARSVDQRINGREPGARAPRIGAALTGHFRVEDGRIRIFEQVVEPSGSND